jgi:hypothetical protein
MPTLAQRLPYLHPFAGGYPYRGSQRLPSDPDALTYLAAVAAADGAPVEVGVAMAVDDFIRGCKADPSGTPGRSNWDAIKASCILCGARTLAGALVPLRDYGPELWDAPTPVIVTAGGTSPGSWDAATQTMSCPLGTTANTPRFQFDLGLVAGSQYVVSGRLSGDTASVTTTRLCKSVCGGETAISYNSSTGLLSGTVTAGGTTTPALELGLDATLGPASVTIESLSIREVIAAPTNVADGFVAGDYTRGGATPGLKGDGTSYLDSNRDSSDDPQDDCHLSVYETQTHVGAAFGASIGGFDTVAPSQKVIFYRDLTLQIVGRLNNQDATSFTRPSTTTGFTGVSRSNGSGLTLRYGGSDNEIAQASVAMTNRNISVYSQDIGGSQSNYCNARMAFYSIGESLDLALLDTRVTALVTAIGAAV